MGVSPSCPSCSKPCTEVWVKPDDLDIRVAVYSILKHGNNPDLNTLDEDSFRVIESSPAAVWICPSISQTECKWNSVERHHQGTGYELVIIRTLLSNSPPTTRRVLPWPFSGDVFSCADLKRHEEEMCPFGPVQCSVCGNKQVLGTSHECRCLNCPGQVIRTSTGEVYRKVHDHKAHHCPDWTCNRCHRIVNTTTIEEHEPNCIIFCFRCEKTVHSRNIETHRQSCNGEECKECGEVDKPSLHILLCSHRLLVCNICGKGVKAKDLQGHTCEVVCPKCTKLVRSEHLDTHKSSECVKRIIECPRCHEESIAEDYPSHICLEVCEKCGMSFRCDVMADHIERDCPMRDLPCPNCGRSFPIDDLPKHQCRVNCPLCMTEVSLKKLDKHLDRCPEKLIDCGRCLATFRLRERDTHICPEIQCRSCGQHRSMTSIENHIRFECKKEENHHDDDDEETTCVVCQDAPRDTVLLPCKHMCYCSHCAQVLLARGDRCATCRSEIQDCMTLYL